MYFLVENWKNAIYVADKKTPKSTRYGSMVKLFMSDCAKTSSFYAYIVV